MKTEKTVSAFHDIFGEFVSLDSLAVTFKKSKSIGTGWARVFVNDKLL